MDWERVNESYHAHFDCFSGAAGDMMLASCLDAVGVGDETGADRLVEHITSCIEGGLPALKGEFSIERHRVWRGGMASIAATHVMVHSRYGHAPAPVPTAPTKSSSRTIIDDGSDHNNNHQHDHHDDHGNKSAAKLKKKSFSEQSHSHSHEHAAHDHAHHRQSQSLAHTHSHDHHHQSAAPEGDPLLSKQHHNHDNLQNISTHSSKNTHDHDINESSHSHSHDHRTASATSATHSHEHNHSDVNSTHKNNSQTNNGNHVADKTTENEETEHADNSQPHHDHSHNHGPGGPLRTFSQIRQMLQDAPTKYIPPWVQEMALAVFTELASAEAKSHGVQSLDAVHFHEVGAIDSIVDTVGTLLALHSLGVTTVSCSRLPMGEGMVSTDHGWLPVPAPATLFLSRDMPTCPGPPGWTGELVTPTGAALLRVLTQRSSTTTATGRPPCFTVRHVGIGAGTKDFQAHPNILRIILGNDLLPTASRNKKG